MGPFARSVLVGMGAFLLLHLWLWRARPSQAPRIVLLGCLGLGGIVAAGVSYRLLGGGDGVGLCAVVWTILFLVIAYVFVYAGIARSVSLTLLTRLLESGNRPMEVERVVEEYAASSRFEDRIRVMQATGLVERSGTTVRLTRKGGRWARGAQRVGRWLGDGLKG